MAAILVNNYYSWSDYLSSFITTGNGGALMISIELPNVARVARARRRGPSTTFLYYSWHVLLQHLASEKRRGFHLQTRKVASRDSSSRGELC